MGHRLTTVSRESHRPTQNGRSCQIDQDLIGADYAPLTTAPFLQYLTSALQGSSKRSSTTGVGPCGLTELQSGIICPPLKADQGAKASVNYGPSICGLPGLI